MAVSKSPPVLVVQHVRSEPAGRISDVLHQRGIERRGVRLFEGDPVPRTLDTACGLVVMGGPMGVGQTDEHPHLRAEMGLVERALAEEVPVLGVCLGSQLLAHVLGARVRPGPRKEIGWSDVTLTQAAHTDPLWQDVGSPFAAFHWHGDVFDVPEGGVRLAYSEQTHCQAFRYGPSAYGLLFHLEVTAEGVAVMIRTFQDELDAVARSGAAIRSATREYMPSLRRIAHTVFGRWPDLLDRPPPVS